MFESKLTFFEEGFGEVSSNILDVLIEKEPCERLLGQEGLSV